MTNQDIAGTIHKKEIEGCPTHINKGFYFCECKFRKCVCCHNGVWIDQGNRQFDDTHFRCIECELYCEIKYDHFKELPHYG